MTVLIKGGDAKDYIGLSTDDRPANVAEGSTYHAVDTGERWISHDGMWENDLRLETALEAVL